MEEELKKEALKNLTQNDFIIPRPGVDLNLSEKRDLQGFIEDLKAFGLENVDVSSGRRGEEELQNILKGRKERFGLQDYPEEVQDIINKVILRGTGPEDLEFPSLTKSRPTHPAYKDYPHWKAKAKGLIGENLEEEERRNLINTLAKVRKGFAGYESPHVKGEKIDIPETSFIERYGEEGSKRFKDLSNYLRERGYKTTYEEGVGGTEKNPADVLDVMLKPRR